MLELQTSLNKLIDQCSSSPNIILLGDFDFPSIVWSDGQGQVCPSPNYGTEVNNLFLDIVSDTGLEQYVDSPTRQGKTLDLVLSTNSNIHDLEVVPGMSDHDAVVFSFSINHVPDQQPPHMAFLYHRADVERIKADLLNFQNSFLQQDPSLMNVKVMWNDFKEAVYNTISKHVPQRTIRSNSGLPWINKELKKDMKVRKCLYDIAKRSNTEGDWSTYRRIKNQINNKLKEAHNNYCSRLFDDSFGGSKRQFWKYIKAKRKDDVGIYTIVVDGKPCTDAKSKAKALNSYFKSVFTKEDTENLPNLADPSSEVLFPNISDITFSVEGIRQLLSNLDTNKASGPDEIPSFILIQFAVEISPILQVIFTKSISSGLLPSDWKKGNICPVFKKGRRDEASNYRPISLTSICSKTMEHIIFHNIMSHLNANDILIENQHGFRAGHSCATQLITLTEDILHALDHQKQVDIILLDFAKAFDTVPLQQDLDRLSEWVHT